MCVRHATRCPTGYTRPKEAQGARESGFVVAVAMPKSLRMRRREGPQLERTAKTQAQADPAAPAREPRQAFNQGRSAIRHRPHPAAEEDLRDE